MVVLYWFHMDVKCMEELNSIRLDGAGYDLNEESKLLKQGFV